MLKPRHRTECRLLLRLHAVATGALGAVSGPYRTWLSEGVADDFAEFQWRPGFTKQAFGWFLCRHNADAVSSF